LRAGSEALPAILLGGAETAVPVCRSLGRGGVPVIAYGSAEDPVRHSRYCTRYVEAKDGEDSGREWLELLLAEPAPGVLVPASDKWVELIARNREALLTHGHVPLCGCDDESLAMLDKGRTYEIAERAGVPIPRFALLHEPADIEPALERIPLPCGIKPLEGHVFRERTGLLDKVIRVEDRERFRELAGTWLGEGLGLMATEIVEGPDDRLYSDFFYIDESGEPLVSFSNRKIRSDPPHFGVGCYVVEEHRPELIELGLRFLAAAGLRGMAHLEYKHDPRDGQFKLIECNPRFHLTIELVLACGLDVPLFAYRRLCGDAPAQPVQRRSGLRLWHPLPDFRAFRILREEGALTLGGWLRSVLHRQRFTVFAADDPWPSVVVNSRTLKRLAGKGMRRALGGAKS
jgi:predicted ATP-grasp superfamily ATP-dependent carboligase